MNESGLKFYVIGDPIDHSLSPLMQNFFLKKFKIKGSYAAKQVRSNELDGAMISFINQRVTGINVTAPLKNQVLKYINKLTNEAENIGSVNTIKIEQDNLIGHNTDAIGFQTTLRVINYSFKTKNATVVGAGGAARSIVAALIREQCKRIIICNRNLNKAARLVADFSQRYSEPEFSVISIDSQALRDAIKSSQLLVNATTVGMGQLIGKTILPATDCLHDDLLVYDLIYRPYKTRLIEQAESCGVRWMNGIDMLILQGIESLKFWSGQNLKLDSSSYALIKNMLRREVCQE